MNRAKIKVKEFRSTMQEEEDKVRRGGAFWCRGEGSIVIYVTHNPFQLRKRFFSLSRMLSLLEGNFSFSCVVDTIAFHTRITACSRCLPLSIR